MVTEHSRFIILIYGSKFPACHSELVRVWEGILNKKKFLQARAEQWKLFAAGTTSKYSIVSLSYDIFCGRVMSFSRPSKDQLSG